jgi:hypothetical protein
VVLPIDWSRYAIGTAPGRRPRLVRDLVPETRGVSGEAPQRRESPALRQELEAVPEEARPKVVLAHARMHVSRILGLPGTKTLDPRQPLSEIGLDSLMAVELRNVLASSSGLSLPATLLFDYPTLEAIAGFLGRGLGLVTEEPVEAPPQPVAVIDRVEELSDDEVDRLLAARISGKRS